MKMLMRRVALLFIFLVGIFIWPNNAECALERDFQTWLNVTAIGKTHSNNKIIGRVRYWLEGQQRFGDDSSRFTQTLVRPGLGYALTESLSIWLGYAWVYTGIPFTTNPFEEDRIWQQLLWTKTNRYLTFTSRTRTEQRFLENNPKTAYRIRELIKISVPIKQYANFNFVTSDELFLHKNNFVGTNSRGFDQNRFFIGLGYKINPIATTEIGYMNQYIRRFGVPNFLTNIVSINLFLSL
ncbi:DUF2490 domain-containing protein [Fluoribacter gormanii]|uniref:Protein of uncharacterized function (DUF2490) n=2 Tax=Fluoribacter gormanii TaxID=464 RepID=A0A377GIG5_9GAMM|nr:DUF2490 domain-containing protein [Fluoribacter gormanii]KTD03569.1 hypothetical protein Lgor_1554 [Fluoribacter gormanii]MCW8472276.1 DUF2490 domain-containing protein [Fluoribacter gormanii]SIQ42658.1 Protein of unknown function [Fluoribacter gormanii]STO24597.1 Protein of uncharacterised function (DUF2490) [Fluoribacter gormanii]